MTFVREFSFCLLMTLLLSCEQREQSGSSLFDRAESRGEVSSQLEEASGLVASVANPGFLWTLNDSGNPAEVFLLNDEAKIVLSCRLRKIQNRDWEDITIGRGPLSGVKYLYIGEIGDNDSKYEFKYLYRFREPAIGKDAEITIDTVDTFVIRLPDGARDMESLTADHSTGDIYMISKREENVNVYLIKYNSLVEFDTLVPEKIAMLPYHNVVAVDFSFDSNELLLKTYDEIYYWQKTDSLTILQTLLTEPKKLRYHREPQGESLAWTIDGKGFYTLSESVDSERAKLYFYKGAK